MCLNLRGENDNGQIFFKNFLEGGENDRGYYGILETLLRIIAKLYLEQA